MFKYITGRIAFAAEGTGGAGDAGAPPAVAGVTEHPVTAPWANAQGVWTLGEGATAKPWFEMIPEPEARAHVAAKQYANPAQLALANYNLTRLHTGDPAVVALPGKDADEKVWNEFYTKLGRPEAPDKYELNFGEGAKVDDALVSFGRSLFYDMGLNNAQAQRAADKWTAFVNEQSAAGAEQFRAKNDMELGELATKWKGAGALEQNKAAGQRAMQALGIDADLLGRIEGAIGAAPVVELLALIGRKSDEGGFTAGNTQTNPNDPATMTPEQAKAKRTELLSDQAFLAKYQDSKHPAHAEAVQLMERLFSRSA